MFCVIGAEWTVSLSLLLLHDMMEKKYLWQNLCAIYKIDILKKTEHEYKFVVNTCWQEEYSELIATYC